MGKVFNVALEAFGEKLRADLDERIKRTQKAKVITAHRSRALFASKTPVDTGQMKNAWVVEDGFNADDAAVVRVWNRAPYAGIVERGARPHKVSAAGREALLRWAMRQMGLEEAEARKAVDAICFRLNKQGQKGQYVVRNQLKKVRQWLKEETERAIKAKP